MDNITHKVVKWRLIQAAISELCVEDNACVADELHLFHSIFIRFSKTCLVADGFYGLGHFISFCARGNKNQGLRNVFYNFLLFKGTLFEPGDIGGGWRLNYALCRGIRLTAAGREVAAVKDYGFSTLWAWAGAVSGPGPAD